jgi:MFS family permease
LYLHFVNIYKTSFLTIIVLQGRKTLVTTSKKRLLFLLSAAHSLNHSLFLILPQVLVLIIDEFQISKFAIGTVAMVASMIYGVGALAGGALSDRINEAKIVTVSLAFSGLSTLTFLFANEVLVFGLGLALIGTWASLYHPVSLALISKVYEEKMGESMGTHGLGGSLGVMFTPIVAALLGATLGWRAAFLFFGVLCVIVSIVLLFTRISAPLPRKFTLHVNEEKSNLLGLCIILLLNVVIGLYMKGIELFFQTYLISYTFSSLKVEIASIIAATAVTSLLAVGVAGQWLGGRASDVFGSKKVLVATSAGVATSLLLLQSIPIPILAVGAFVLLYGFSFNAHQPALNSLLGKLAPINRRGAIYGVYFFMTFGIGSLSQSLTGYLADVYGLQLAFHVLFCFAVVALLMSFLVPNLTRAKNHAPVHATSK